MVIEAVWGLGEAIVQGAVTPDRHVLDKATLHPVLSEIAEKEFLLAWDEASHSTVRIDLAGDPRARRPVLTAEELAALGALAKRAEEHYHVPQDLEFAIDGQAIYLTQSRPITTLGGGKATPAPTGGTTDVKPIAHGLGASPGRATGPVRVLNSTAEESSMQKGEILVTRMTSPDWVPIMRRAAAIVTDSGGMTSHAAIVARELGLPCVVGAHDATRVLSTGAVVTVDGAAGTVVPGSMSAPETPAPAPASVAPAPAQRRGVVTATRLYVNLAEPDRAEDIATRDVDGVGLLRAEFMMLDALEQTHPRAFLAERSGDEFVQRMTDKLRVFAKAFHPRPVIYRAMDFRTNEFRGLKGGDAHEPNEANPMIGYRGCFRYTREPDLFALELRALQEVRRDFDNLHLMIPFVRTARELEECLHLVDASPLGSDRRLLRWIMAEVPSVVYWLPRYAAMGIAGVSIGSNDLTQLMLGVDRDSELFGPTYDERDGAVLDAIRQIVVECRRLGLTSSICGQAPSVHPEYAESLVEWGIDSISVNPDAIDRTRENIARAEMRMMLAHARAASAHARI
jgi:pyruvate,water dikinase